MPLRLFILFSLVVIAGCSSGSPHAAVLHGKVIKVLDGDSIIVKTDKTRIEVRLYGIDSPEYDQPYASGSKNMTKGLIMGKKVEVKSVDKDKYGRVIALVYRGRKCINEELVKQGGAWVYDNYCKKDMCGKWKGFEAAAQGDRLGLWKKSNPVPPWSWRREKQGR